MEALKGTYGESVEYGIWLIEYGEVMHGISRVETSIFRNLRSCGKVVRKDRNDRVVENCRRFSPASMHRFSPIQPTGIPPFAIDVEGRR